MSLLITGLVVFFGIHVVPWFPGLRTALVTRLGYRGYRGMFALIALIGFVLIVLGKRWADFVPLYQPPAWGHWLALPLVLVAFILLPASHMPSNVKRFTRHPMNWGVTLWGIAHLSANGDLAGVLLFGSFLAYSLADMVSANARGAQLSATRYPVTQDLKLVAAGAVAYIVLLLLHPYLFGHRVL